MHFAHKRSYVGFQNYSCEYERITSRKSLSQPNRVPEPAGSGIGFAEYCILAVFYKFLAGNGDLIRAMRKSTLILLHIEFNIDFAADGDLTKRKSILPSQTFAHKRSYVGFQNYSCDYERITNRKSLSQPDRLPEPAGSGNRCAENCILALFYELFRGERRLDTSNENQH